MLKNRARGKGLTGTNSEDTVYTTVETSNVQKMVEH